MQDLKDIAVKIQMNYLGKSIAIEKKREPSICSRGIIVFPILSPVTSIILSLSLYVAAISRELERA